MAHCESLFITKKGAEDFWGLGLGLGDLKHGGEGLGKATQQSRTCGYNKLIFELLLSTEKTRMCLGWVSRDTEKESTWERKEGRKVRREKGRGDRR